MRLHSPLMASILIIEDDPDNRGLFNRWLSRDGHDTTCCRTGEQALGCLDGGHFDVVVLDIGLPGVDGFQVARQIGPGLLEDARIIAATKYENDDCPRDIKVFQWLTKPFSRTDLREAVQWAGTG